MSGSQHSLPVNQSEPHAADATPDHACRLADEGESGGEFGMENGVESGGRTLLSRALAPQGRRSLFRR